MVHRVDGPVGIYRSRDEGVDTHVWAMNREFADATIFQSEYSQLKHLELGLVFKEPVVIHYAADPKIFNCHNRLQFDRKRKIKLLSMSWSDNPNKGMATYKWLEDHLDWNRYEYTFVGRSLITFERVKMVPPIPSESIAELMREHDVFITASRHESCSNALIEALTCGLPSIYVKSGSNGEIVGSGGIGFDQMEELPSCLEKLISDYSNFQRAICVPKLSEIASRYRMVLGIGS